jgi:hypothetical protein
MANWSGPQQIVMDRPYRSQVSLPLYLQPHEFLSVLPQISSDAPLSDVKSSVGVHIFRKCIYCFKIMKSVTKNI